MQIPRCKPSLTPLLATLLAIGCGAALPEADTSTNANVIYGSRVHKMPKMESSSSVTPNANSATLTYYGGRVNSATQVVTVLWGSGTYLPQVTSTATPSMATFYQQVLNSAYVDWLDQEYNTVSPSPAGNSTKTNQHIGRGSWSQQVQITPSTTASTIDDSKIQSELAAQIQAGHLPAPQHDAAGNNITYYAVFFPHGKTITQGGSSSCVSGGFCAYHGTVASVPGFGEIYYGVHPDMESGSGCDTGCGGASSAFGNYTSVASHELIEMVTDAEVGLATNNAPPLAWYDSSQGEIGDICNASQGSIVGGDGQTYTVQKEWSNRSNACIVSETVTTTNNFSVAVSPSSQSVNAGSSVSYTVTTATTAGSAQTVSLSVSGLPAGVTGSFSPSSVSSGQSSTLTLTASSSAASATATFTVTGSAASGTHTATASVSVVGATQTNDFSVAVSPSSQSVNAGSSVSYSVTTATVKGSAQSVSLSVSGLPSGVSGSFSPASVTSGGSSTLTLSASSSAASASATFTVTGSASSGSHAATASVTVVGGSTGGTALVNGDFEAGSLSGWTASGASESVVSSGCHGGTYCARLGSTSPTNGDSNIAQTFTPSSSGTLSVWYKETCPDTVTYDWALATLKDNTAGTTTTLIAKSCATNAWTQKSASVIGGHSYTLTLNSHDDNYSGDATYTMYDDVSIGAGSPPPTGGITNGGFEAGSLSGWTASGAHTGVTTSSHSGGYAAVAGDTSPTSGDSSLAQTFTAPSGASSLSLWYANSCPDTVSYDWVTVTLKDNTSGTTKTVVPKTCASSYVWTSVSASVTAGHSYTLTLTSHDDNYSGDPTYTLFDDVALQ